MIKEKEYRLLKDLPCCPAGNIFVKKKTGYTCNISSNSYLGFPKGVVEYSTDWFESLEKRIIKEDDTVVIRRRKGKDNGK